METHSIRVVRSSQHGRVAKCDTCRKESVLTGVHHAVSRAMDRLDDMAGAEGRRIVHVTGLTMRPEQPTVKP